MGALRIAGNPRLAAYNFSHSIFSRCFSHLSRLRTGRFQAVVRAWGLHGGAANMRAASMLCLVLLPHSSWIHGAAGGSRFFQKLRRRRGFEKEPGIVDLVPSLMRVPSVIYMKLLVFYYLNTNLLFPRSMRLSGDVASITLALTPNFLHVFLTFHVLNRAINNALNREKFALARFIWLT
jgi:hypothetical protein